MKKTLGKIFSICLVLTMIFSTMISPAYATTQYHSTQTVTGYYSTGTVKPASGATYQVGFVAVHPKTKGTINPIYPFGAIITLDNGDTIPTPIGELSVFNVQDIGDQDYAKWNAGKITWNWFDVYCGRPADYGWTTTQMINWINNNIQTQYVDYFVQW